MKNEEYVGKQANLLHKHEGMNEVKLREDRWK